MSKEIPEKIKAAVLCDLGRPLELIDLQVPEISEGQVLVKMYYSGLCHSQLMEVRGKRGADKYLPHLLGHEGTGIVVGVGHKVSKVKLGDKLILTWIKGDGIDCKGPVYKYGKQIINAGPITTLSEYTIVAENRCVKLPEDMPL